MNAEEVLDVLAEYQESLNWLANDGRQHIADARLSVFRSDEHFAVVTEFPHFFYGGEDFTNWLGYAGNCLSPEVHKATFPNRRLIEEVPDPSAERDDCYPTWKGLFLDRNEFSVNVDGQHFDFRPSNEDYARVGISFDDKEKQSSIISPGQLLRFISVALNHPFFFSGSELRALIAPSVEPTMSLFVQTNWWQHPEFLVTGDGSGFESDWIENIPCWQILARAIASGDLSEWNSQDTSGFNTDWVSLERIYHQHNTGYGFG